jgi:hypothetical protein
LLSRQSIPDGQNRLTSQIKLADAASLDLVHLYGTLFIVHTVPDVFLAHTPRVDE